MFKYIEFNWYKFMQLEGSLAAKALKEIYDLDNNKNLSGFTLGEYARSCDEILENCISLQNSKNEAKYIQPYEDYLENETK